MENPFRYGDIVRGAYFTDREKEIAELLSDIRSGQNVFIYSPRKYGKSSLISAVLERAQKEKTIPIRIDCFQISSKTRFAEIYAKAVSSAISSKMEEIKKFMREYLPSFLPKFALKLGGIFELELSFGGKKKDLPEAMLDLYDLPEILCKRKKKKAVVAFDEFQEIQNLDGLQTEKEMRSKFQHHENVSYIFVGSKKHLLLQMFTDKKRPFYNFGKMISLPKIPHDDLLIFIKKRFSKTNIKFDAELPEKILAVTGDHPYFTQMLCHELWDICYDKGKVEAKDIDPAIEQIIRNHGDLYITLWDRISFHQKSLLAAIAVHGGENIFSSSFISENTLGAVSSVQKSAAALVDRDLLEKINGGFEYSDIFFKEWIKRKII